MQQNLKQNINDRTKYATDEANYLNIISYLPMDIRNIIGGYTGQPAHWNKHRMDNIIQIINMSHIVISRNGCICFTDKLISILTTELAYHLGRGVQVGVILYNLNGFKIDKLHTYINDMDNALIT